MATKKKPVAKKATVKKAPAKKPVAKKPATKAAPKMPPLKKPTVRRPDQNLPPEAATINSVTSDVQFLTEFLSSYAAHLRALDRRAARSASYDIVKG